MKHIILAFFAIMLVACAEKEDESVRVSFETSVGSFVVEVYPDKAPITTANFLRYVDEDLYGGATFYRTTRPDNDPMIEVIQGGLWRPWLDESGDTAEAPLPDIPHETTEVSGLSHTDGTISMARLEPGTASSEIFITIGDNRELDFGGERNPDGQGFAAFGKVVEGMDVVRAINAAETNEGEGFDGQIIANPVAINSVRRL